MQAKNNSKYIIKLNIRMNCQNKTKTVTVADHMMLYIEDSKIFYSVKTTGSSSLNSVEFQGYKINRQKYISFLYTNNNKSEQ